MAVLMRIQRAVVRGLCGVRRIDEHNYEKLMGVSGLREMLDKYLSK